MRVLSWILALAFLSATNRAAEHAVLVGIDEYEVYTAVIQQEFWKPDTRIALIDANTHLVTAQPDSWPYSNLSNLKGLQTETVNSLRAKPNGEIRYVFPFDKDYRIVDGEQDLARLWPDYPHSTGVILFSRVGFNADATQALVYVRQYGGSGEEKWLLLSRQSGGEWKVSASVVNGAS